MSFVLKTAQFESALREYQSATKKDMSEVLNRALRNVGYRAAQFTPKKNASVIEAEIRKDQIGLKFITKKLRGRIGKTYETAKGRKRTIRRVTRKQIALRTKQFVSRRKKRVGFLRAGWVAAMVGAGVSKGVSGEKLLKDGKSKIGSGRKATPQRLNAYLGNAVWGRLKGKGGVKVRGQMQRALNRAMAFVAKDMSDYAGEKMKKTAARYSARRGR